MAKKETQLDGMPDPQVIMTVKYALERSTFVDKDELIDVGDTVHGPSGAGGLKFVVVKVTHTRDKNDHDVYTVTTVEDE